MKTFSFILASTLLLFAALLLYDSATQAQSEKKVTTRYSGTVVIKQAIEQFRTVQTIESKVRLECHFFGERYRGHGAYFEKRLPMVSEPDVSANRFLLDLQFQADSFLSWGNRSSKLKIVATGSDVWKYTEIEDEKRQERVDLAKLQDVLAKSHKGNGNTNSSQSIGWGELTSLGGLEETLIQIAKFYDFDSASVESESLGSENLAIWKVSAKLKPDRLQAMIDSYGGNKAVAKHGGEHIPAAVCLYIGKEDFFPYRICYFNGIKENPFNNPPGIDLEYRDVSINGNDIPTSRFDFKGVENVFINDITEDYAKRILGEN